MKFALAAVLFATAALAAPKAKPKGPLSRTAGKVIASQAKIAPSADGPVFREGRLTLLDKADHTEELKVTPRTKVTLNGKPAKFEKSAPVGTLVLKALYNPDTKELASLDLRSVPKIDADDASGGQTKGEVANTDILKNTLSVRIGRQTIRDFAVTDATTIMREAEGKATPIGLDAIKVGDAVEVTSVDGKTATEVHVSLGP